MCNGSFWAMAVLFGVRYGVDVLCRCVVRVCGNRKRAFICNWLAMCVLLVFFMRCCVSLWCCLVRPQRPNKWCGFGLMCGFAMYFCMHICFGRFLVHDFRCLPRRMGLVTLRVLCVFSVFVCSFLCLARFGWPPFLCKSSCWALAVLFGVRCGVGVSCLCIVRLNGNRKHTCICNILDICVVLCCCYVCLCVVCVVVLCVRNGSTNMWDIGRMCGFTMCMLHARLFWSFFLVHDYRWFPKHMGLNTRCVSVVPPPCFLVRVPCVARFGWPPFLCNGSFWAVVVLFGVQYGVDVACLCVVRLCGNRKRAFTCNRLAMCCFVVVFLLLCRCCVFFRVVVLCVRNGPTNVTALAERVAPQRCSLHAHLFWVHSLGRDYRCLPKHMGLDIPCVCWCCFVLLVVPVCCPFWVATVLVQWLFLGRGRVV